ncbi:MAG: alpha/beta hydrolase [Chloroflexi bacterium]|nr:alpha/beta hydrolase [Chloroflexota bacterium]
MEILSTKRLSNGILERRFTVPGATGPVPGALWTREGGSGPVPLILLGHGGGGSKDAPNNLDSRDYFTGERGIGTAAIDGPAHGDRGPVTAVSHPAYAEMWQRPTAHDDMNADWRATLGALLALGEFDPQGVGYYGLSMGTMFGLPYLAAEPRISVAVLGLCGLRGPAIVLSGIGGRLAVDAPRVTCPLMYHVQWDDERFDRDGALELYGMLGAADKRLQSTPGPHGGITAEARDALRAFIAGRLAAVPAAV